MHHGLSQVRVAELRARYAQIGFAGDETDPAFLTDLNEILEHLYSLNDWKGGSGVFSLALSSTGRVTLPYFLEGIKACRLDKTPRPVLSVGYEFLRHGPGDLEDQGLGMVVPEGEFPVRAEFPSTPATITLTSSQDDSTKICRLYGLDDEGNEVRDSEGLPGIDLTIGAGASSVTFASLTGVVKPITRGRVTVTLNTATPLVLSVYEPSVTIPLYRRYKVDPVSTESNLAGETLEAWCSRRVVPVVNEEDWVVPGNSRGWKLALIAQAMENNSDRNAATFWQNAVDAFNQEIEKHTSGENQIPNIQIFGLEVGNIEPVR